jgi:AraC family transcriptional regulator of adaptative response / DNA-3-methyladenine glycosylase II
VELRAFPPSGLDRISCYRALCSRDARFDGRFYTAVLSTGIYCRPICPARPPRIEHCAFFPSAAAAQAAGFRPCLRCRPELAPGIAGWRGTANTVQRAMALIAQGTAEPGGDVESLADRLGVGSRHLRRLFERHVGASPATVAQAQRVLFAKKLLAETTLPIAEVAIASGFGSLRRFNEVMRRTFGRPPRELRRARSGSGSSASITLRLSHTLPYDWGSMLDFLRLRAIPGVERVEGDSYRRTIWLAGAAGTFAVRPGPGGDHLRATIRFPILAALPALVSRIRALLDLDADVEAIDAHLARDPLLAPLIAARPGLRVPGAWDAFELAVRAILGQQISVAAARTLAARLVKAHGTAVAGAYDPGELQHLFPGPELVAQADLTRLGLTRARAAALAALAALVRDDPARLSPRGDLEAVVAELTELPGIGPWTAQIIAMRALRAPDAFPASDLGLLRALGGVTLGRPGVAQVLARAEAWRPWRAYAVLHLWSKDQPSAQEGRSWTAP